MTMTLDELRDAIPAAIDALGGDSRVSALDYDAWAIFRGSATGYVALISGAEDGNESAEQDRNAIVHITFPILRVPEHGAEPLLRHLLELNHELGDFACFSLDRRNKVWLGAGRFAADLDPPELRVLIAQIAQLADQYGDELLDQFGRELAVQ
jgi:hypothetical protein